MRLPISPSYDLAPIWHHFGDRPIAGICAHDPTPIHHHHHHHHHLLAPPMLWMFPLDQIADVGVNVSMSLKLFGLYYMHGGS